MIRRHIKVKGRVQGVGFRYTVTGIAQKKHLTGWIKNNYDGSVEMEVQGADHRIEDFIQEVTSEAPGGNRWIKIKSYEVSAIPLVNVTKETSFRPKHY